MENNDDKFSNKSVAQLLRSMAAAYLLLGENRFKTIAYEKAADAVEHLTREIKDLWQENKIEHIPNIGSSISGHLDEYFEKGYSSHFNEVLSKIPSPVFELMKIPGLGPRKSFKLVKNLNIKDKKTAIEQLKKACLQGKIAEVETFGEKSQAEILASIREYKKKAIHKERMPLPYAYAAASDMISYLKKNSKISQIDALGSLRRMVPTIGDIDIAIKLKTPACRQARQNSNPKFLSKELVKYFIDYPKKTSIINAGEKKATILISGNKQIDLRLQEAKNYGSMLQYFTGSKTHNIKLREYALKKGFSLSEYGIKVLNKVKSLKLKVKSYDSKLKIFQFETEDKFYNFLGIQYIPPELREGTDEVEMALKKKLPKLVELSDIKGDLHVHSSFDLQPSHDLGENSFEELASKGLLLRYEYIGIADHNPKMSLRVDRVYDILKKRKLEIDKINSYNKVDRSKILIGIEVDILPNGKIALSDNTMSQVDYLIASIHSSFKMTLQQMTERVLKALQHPKVKILGHPTGRMLLKREGYELDWGKIFKQCKKRNIALEINAWPERLDLPDILVREAINFGVKLIINTDAHAIKEMDNMFYGVSVARRGWAKKSDIINTLSYNEIKYWLKRG